MDMELLLFSLARRSGYLVLASSNKQMPYRISFIIFMTLAARGLPATGPGRLILFFSHNAAVRKRPKT